MEREHKCCNKEKVKRGPWSEEEDEMLCIYVRNNDPIIRWSSIPELTGLSKSFFYLFTTFKFMIIKFNISRCY